MARDDPHFRLRLPEELRDKLKLASEANGRSVNAEVVARLLATFSTEPLPGDPVVGAELMTAVRIAASEALERLLTEPDYRKRLRDAASRE